MNAFYNRFLTAFFLGDTPNTRKRARELYRDYGISSIVADRRISLFCRACPFIKTVPLKQTDNPDITLDTIDSAISEKRESSYLLFVDSPSFAKTVKQNISFFQTRFLTDTQSVINDLK